MSNAQSADSEAQGSEDPHSLTDVLDKLLETSDQEKVSIDDLISAFDNRSYGPLLLVPSLLALIPIIGGIPGMSILTGSIIILIAGQMLFKQGNPWLPERVRNFEFSRDKLESAIDMVRPYVEKVERWIKPRLTELTTKPFSYAIPVVSILFALTMFPLALLPFAVAVPALALTLLSIGLTLKDGYFVIAGYALGAAAIFMLSYTI